MGVNADVFDAPEIARAKRAIAARGLHVARPKMWIRREVLEKIVNWCDERPSFKEYGMLYLVAYAFLLRLPSEALPMRSASPEVPDGQSVLRCEGDWVVLTLARRKNRPHRTQLVRTCWCKESKKTCPVHRLGPWLGAAPLGGALFPAVTAARALGKLRDILWLLGPAQLTALAPHARCVAAGVEESAAYRTHDLRRGHALDLQLSGAALSPPCISQLQDASHARCPSVGNPVSRRLEFAGLHGLP